MLGCKIEKKYFNVFYLFNFFRIGQSEEVEAFDISNFFPNSFDFELFKLNWVLLIIVFWFTFWADMEYT